MPKKTCLRHHLNLCQAPCINQIDKKEFNNSIKNVESFLKGNSIELINKLKQDMKKYSSEFKYENAKIIRDQIIAIKSLNKKQKLEKNVDYDQDIINYVTDKNDNKIYLIVFNVSKNILTSKNEFSFDFSNNLFEEFIIKYYSKNKIPKKIIIPCKLKDESIQKYLETLCFKPLTITIPKKIRQVLNV